MTTIWSWNSSADSFTSFTGTVPTYSSGGSYGERAVWAANTAQAYGRKTMPSALTGDHAIRFIYTIASFAGSSHTLLEALDSTPAQVYKFDMGSDGHLRMRNAAGTLITTGTGTATQTNTEYRMEVYRVGTTLTIKQYRVSDNALMDTITGTIATTAVASAWFGNSASLTGTLGQTTYDAIEVRDVGAEIGPPAGAALSASAVASPDSGTPPYTQTLTVTASGGSGTYSYQVLDWGDGSTSSPQSSNVFTKTIAVGAASGTRTASIRVTG